MRTNKSLGISSGLRPLHNFTVKLRIKYETTYGSEVGKNAEIKVVAEDLGTAREIAYNKAKAELKDEELKDRLDTIVAAQKGKVIKY